MLKSKVFSLIDIQLDNSVLECEEHKIPKKYYSLSKNQFYCEHDEQDVDCMHFRLILDKYHEDIKRIKSLDLKDTTTIMEIYNQSADLYEKISEEQQNFTKFFYEFNQGTFSRIFYLINQDNEIFKLKDIIENINFLPNGRADYVGIGADSQREMSYLILAKILIERNINFNKNDNPKNLSFQLLKFCEYLQNNLIGLVDKSYMLIKYIFEKLVIEVAKLEGSKVDVDYMNHFNLYYIHRQEYNELKEKSIYQINENNNFKIKIATLENDLNSIKRDTTNFTSERDILINKNKEDKSMIDSLTSTNKELVTELNNLKNLNIKISGEIESSNKKLNEYALSLKNYELAIQTIKNKNEDYFKQLQNLNNELNLEKNKSFDFINENSVLKNTINNLDIELNQIRNKYDSKLKEISDMNNSHNNKIQQTNLQLTDMEQIKQNHEAEISNLEKEIRELRKGYELKLNELNKLAKENEDKYKNFKVNSNKEISNLKNNVDELQSKISETFKIKDKHIFDLNENNKKLTASNINSEQKLKESVDKNDFNIKRIIQMEGEMQEIKKNYIKKSDVSNLEEKIKELNSINFDLKCLNNALNKRITEVEFNLNETENKLKILTKEKECLLNHNKDLQILYNSGKEDSNKKKTDEDRKFIDLSLKLNDVTRLYEADQKKIKEFDITLKQEREKFNQISFINEKQIKDLKLIIDEIYKGRDNHEIELENQKRKNLELIKDNQALIEKNKNLSLINESLSVNNSECGELTHQLEELKLQLHSQINQNELMTLRIEELEREIKFEKTKNPNTTGLKIQEIKTQYNNLFLQKEKLEKEIIDKKTKISQLQFLNENLNSKIEMISSEINSFKDQNKNSISNQNQIKNLSSQIEELNKIKMQCEVENTELKNKLNKNKMENDQIKLLNEQSQILINKLKDELEESRKYEKKLDILSNSKAEIEKLRQNFDKKTNGSSKNSNNNTLSNSKSLKSFNDLNDFSSNKKNMNTINDSEINPNITQNPQNNFSYNNIDFIKNNPTNLLINSRQWSLVKEWFNSLKIGLNGKLNLNLLMKASKDGYGWNVFGEKCHGKAPTLIVVLTSFDKLIGGFTPLPWSKCEDEFQYVPDESRKSFLFSLSLGKKYNIKSFEFAICNGNEIGPIFGGGSDLEIVHNCNISINNYSNIGHTYDYVGDPANFYGGMTFTVKDYEVYEVKY